MKIAAFCEVGIGGAERVLLEYCGELARRGWAMHVIAGGLLDGEAREVWRDWGQGLDFVELPWRRRTAYRMPVILPSLDRQAAGGLKARLAEIRPDIVLVNQPGPDDAQGAIRAASKLSGVPVACLVHMPAMDGVLLWRTKRWWARRLYRRVDRIIANSEATANSLARCYALPADKVSVAWNGVKNSDPPSPEVRERLRKDMGAAEGDVLALWAGRFTCEKGVDVLLDATRRLRHESCVILALAGDGPLREDMQKEYADIFGSGRVRFLGWRRDVAELLHASDMAVMPSRIESFGLFLVEAMAAGLPAVATDVCGIPDVVVNGETGVLVPPDDPGSLAEAIEALAADTELRHAMGSAGRKRYEERFTFARAADRFEQVLRSLNGV